MVRSDLSHIGAGVRANDLLGVRTDCVGLNADVDQLYASLPAPDPTLTAQFNRAAVTYLGPGALACYRLRSLSGPRYVAVANDFRHGAALLDQAAARLRRFGVR